MTARQFPLLLALVTATLAQAQGTVLNVRDLGAVGDGREDDTAALQQAIRQAPAQGGEIFLPAGIYRITETLNMERADARGILVRGQGGTPYGGTPTLRAARTTTLLWDGEEGGTLVRTVGASGCAWKHLNFDGGGKAGILFLARTETGWGNMINTMHNVHFFRGGVGIQMAETRGEHCASDILFDFVTFGSLDTGFRVTNDQGVDYLFNFVFALNVGTLFQFERGGNLTIQNAQLTNCNLFLDIGGGGRNVGTYVATNVRIESSDGGRDKRHQLLRSHPQWHQANVKFIGYTDAQWDWNSNRTERRHLPLCDIGPGSVVTIESSNFNSPVARLVGTENAPANLILRECSFGFVRPGDALAANEFGHFQTINCFTDKMVPLPDLRKWPALPATEIAEPDYQGRALVPLATDE